MSSVALNMITKRRKSIEDAKARLAELDAERETVTTMVEGLEAEVASLEDELPAKAKPAVKKK